MSMQTVLHGGQLVGIDDETGALLTCPTSGVTVKRAKIDAASADAAGNVVIAAVEGKKICVLGMRFVVDDDVTVTLYSGPANTGTPLSGAMSIGAQSGFHVANPASPDMHEIETVAGDALTLKLSAAVQVSGFITYYEDLG